ncbi:hypothetical protein H1S01_12420 [Heliobacterium chlorum]|uniref:Guanylate cyclase domain-containing protein n=1 Tax=Heliobacterium chlorum TaxID=2698 RepID=A0ABR7T3F6_HELCL|nr:adenylate/guanylate cyclase domain-containing protein [Heliobacterium chlorum]MBC9785314.1 hypothetical protein [Heliobacterium chlorum]
METELFPQFDSVKNCQPYCNVFFDLVDSALLKKLLGAMEGVSVALRHNELCARVVQKYGGQVVKHIGDAIYAVFPNPLPAALAALEVKHMIHKQNLTYRTKIGISFGLVIPVWTPAADYLGASVDLAARLCGYAGPSQIVLDEATFSILKPLFKSFDNIIYQFLGLRELKGFSTMALYELSLGALGFADELPSESPQKSPSPSIPSISPIALSPLVKTYLEPMQSSDELFERFLRRIALKSEEVERNYATLQNVSNALQDTYDFPFKRVTFSGSFARGTMIRPQKAIDILLFIPGQEPKVPPVTDLLLKVQNALAETGFKELQMHRLYLSIGAEEEYRIHPVLISTVDDRDSYYVPLGPDMWVPRDPTASDKWMEGALQRNGSSFLALIRLLKAWQRTNCRILHALHLEMLTDLLLRKVQLEPTPEGVYTWFRYVHQIFSQHKKPFIPDPGDPVSYLDGYLWTNPTSFNQFGRLLTSSLQTATEAVTLAQQNQPFQSRAKWRALLGTSFGN